MTKRQQKAKTKRVNILSIIQGIHKFSTQRVSVNSIRKIIYIKPDLSETPNFSCNIVPQDPTQQQSIKAIYDAAANPLTYVGGSDYSDWTGPKTYLDINLAQYMTNPGDWAAIAINFEDNDPDLDEFQYSFVFTRNGSILDPGYAVTEGEVRGKLFWLANDAFQYGTGSNPKWPTTERRTVVFACQYVAAPANPNYIPFNLGIVATSMDDPNVVIPMVIDPKIKNDG